MPVGESTTSQNTQGNPLEAWVTKEAGARRRPSFFTFLLAESGSDPRLLPADQWRAPGADRCVSPPPRARFAQIHSTENHFVFKPSYGYTVRRQKVFAYYGLGAKIKETTRRTIGTGQDDGRDSFSLAVRKWPLPVIDSPACLGVPLRGQGVVKFAGIQCMGPAGPRPLRGVAGRLSRHGKAGARGSLPGRPGLAPVLFQTDRSS